MKTLFSDDDFAEMYKNYSVMSVERFKDWCVEQIQKKSKSSNLKKAEIIISIRKNQSKDRIVKKMTDFYLAGEGLKVHKVS